MPVSDTLIRTVLDWQRRENAALQGKTVLCAVSGGRDSMALLHVLLRLAPLLGFAVSAAHYNHHLRESADRDEELVRRWCSEHGVPLTVGGGDVRTFAKEHGASIEDAARTLRYSFLQDAAEERGADLIATAHHRRDNAETVLLHLLRGSGLKGLGGIAPLRGNIIRPLLEADREDIDAYISKNHLPYAEDETNLDTAYARNRLRLELLPLLEEISPGSVNRIADAAARLRADEEHLRRESEALTPQTETDGSICIPEAVLRKQDRAISVRIAQNAVRRLGGELTARQTEAVFQLRSGGCLALGRDLRAVKEGKYLRFFRVIPLPDAMPLSSGKNYWGNTVVSVYRSDPPVREDRCTVVLRADIRDLTIAAWNGTGRLTISNGRRTIKRLLTDHGIPAAARESCPAIFSEGKLIAVFGAGTELSMQPAAEDKKIVISLEHQV